MGGIDKRVCVFVQAHSLSLSLSLFFQYPERIKAATGLNTLFC